MQVIKIQQTKFLINNKVYDFVSIEKQPEFPVGIAKFYGYLGKAIKYPPMAQENNVQGKVFLTFVVEKDGEELLVPAQEEFIVGIDQKQKLITVELPEGLLNLEELEDDR